MFDDDDYDYEDLDNDFYDFGDEDQNDIMRMIDEYEEEHDISPNLNPVFDLEAQYWLSEVRVLRHEKKWHQIIKMSPDKSHIVKSFLWDSAFGLSILSFCISNWYQKLPAQNSQDSATRALSSYLTSFFDICIERALSLEITEISLSTKAYWYYFNGVINKSLKCAEIAVSCYNELMEFICPKEITYPNGYRYIRIKEFQNEKSTNYHLISTWYECLNGYDKLILRYNDSSEDERSINKHYYRKALYHYSKISIMHLLRYNTARNALIKYRYNNQIVIRPSFRSKTRAVSIHKIDQLIEQCYQLTDHTCRIESIESYEPNYIDVLYRKSQIAFLKGAHYTFINHDGQKFFLESLLLTNQAIKDANNLFKCTNMLFPWYVIGVMACDLFALGQNEKALNVLDTALGRIPKKDTITRPTLEKIRAMINRYHTANK